MIVLLIALLSICTIYASDEYSPMRMMGDELASNRGRSVSSDCLHLSCPIEKNGMLSVLSRTTQVIISGACLACCLGLCCVHEYTVDIAQRVMDSYDAYAAKKVRIMHEHWIQEKKAQ